MVEVVLTVPHAFCLTTEEQQCDPFAKTIAETLKNELEEGYSIDATVVEAFQHRSDFLVSRTVFGKCGRAATTDSNRVATVALALRSGSSSGQFHRKLASTLQALEKNEKCVILLDIHTFNGEAFNTSKNLVLLTIAANREFNAALGQGVTYEGVPVAEIKVDGADNAIIELYSSLMPTALLEFRNSKPFGPTVRAVAKTLSQLKNQVHRCSGVDSSSISSSKCWIL